MTKRFLASLRCLFVPKPSVSHRVAVWALSGRTGLSSETLARETLGLPPGKDGWGISHPHDTGDLGRCLKLIEQVPEARKAVDSLARKDKNWAGLALVWDKLTALYYDEGVSGPKDKWSHPSREKTYALMRQVLGGY